MLWWAAAKRRAASDDNSIPKNDKKRKSRVHLSMTLLQIGVEKARGMWYNAAEGPTVPRGTDGDWKGSGIC